LRPSGKVQIDGKTFEASSEGTWIDTDAEVFVVGRSSFGLVVRPATEAGEGPRDDSTESVVSGGNAAETTPLNAPPALVERINAFRFGLIAAGILVSLGLLAGKPLTLSALFAPVGGMLAGLVFQGCVRGASDFVGPRVDHRFLAYIVATLAILGAATGVIFGLGSEFGYLGLSAGLVLGTLLGGLLAWGGIISMM
jgi:hypothetical protein